MTAQPSSTPPAAPSATAPTDKEGFWGHVNPFARKKWVKKRLDPINDRLTELDQVNAKNASDIKDVDARAQAGIQKAQSTADSANQVATAANTQAQNAGNVAQGASGHVDQINTTVNGLDQYSRSTMSTSPSAAALPCSPRMRRVNSTHWHPALLATRATSSRSKHALRVPERLVSRVRRRLAETVERYLVTEHQIPVYRMHYVALGNAPVVETASADSNAKPERVRKGSVHIRLMENSLAAQDSASPHAAVSN